MLEKIITNKILLGMCIILVPTSVWAMGFTVDFVLETRDRNTEIKLMKEELSDIKSDVNDIHWYLIGNPQEQASIQE